jgi:hypothetical protein
MSPVAPGAGGDDRPPESKASKTQRERNDERRRQQLEDIDQKVRAGTLVIRQMTAEERERMAPHPRKADP